MNFIGDVAGRFDELQLLLAKMPKEDTYLIGDLVDRGPKSKEVIEFVMNTPGIFAIKGNHEDMMARAHYNRQYGDEYLWIRNGGNPTLKSYGVQRASELPKEHIEWIKNLPLEFKKEGLLVTHAPQPYYVFGAAVDLWTREVDDIEGIVQIFGHNGELKQYGNPAWAFCIDNSLKKELCGIHWPSLQIYCQDYLT